MKVAQYLEEVKKFSKDINEQIAQANKIKIPEKKFNELNKINAYNFPKRTSGNFKVFFSVLSGLIVSMAGMLILGQNVDLVQSESLSTLEALGASSAIIAGLVTTGVSAAYKTKKQKMADTNGAVVKRALDIKIHTAVESALNDLRAQIKPGNVITDGICETFNKLFQKEYPQYAKNEKTPAPGPK